MLPKTKKKQALFLDRDGIINRMYKYDYGYDSPQKPSDVLIIKSIVDIIKWANNNDVFVIEISNQPSVAKGKIDQQTNNNIEKKIHNNLAAFGAKIDYKYICQHYPNGIVPELSIECDCRKPKPGLLIKAAKEHNIDLKTSIFLGDKNTDAMAGKAIGCYTILFLHEEDDPAKVKMARKSPADFKSNSLEEILTKIQNFWRK